MSEETKEILNHLIEYLQDKIDTGYHKIFYNDLMYDEKTVDCINAINDTIKEDVCSISYDKLKDYITKLKTQLQQKENIIKEVREYIEPIVELDNDIMLKGKVLKPVLEMSDKGSDKE